MTLNKIIYVVLCLLVLIKKANSDHNNKAIDIEWEAARPPFDPNIYKEILDPELCAKQIDYLISNDTRLIITCKYYRRVLYAFCTSFKI